MHVSRRHSRRLLLPPGWVALGFLLLLGCQVLISQLVGRQIECITQITMPSLRVDPSTSWNDVVYKSSTELNILRPWHDTEFIGMPLADFINAAKTESIALAIQADSNQEGGVRIRFGKHATYGNLVEVLDIMSRVNQAKYWLDIMHKPTTLYAITENLTSYKCSQLTAPPCGGMSYYSPQNETSFQQRLTTSWHQTWRPLALLLALISTLSIYRLTRQLRAAR